MDKQQTIDAERNFVLRCLETKVSGSNYQTDRKNTFTNGKLIHRAPWMERERERRDGMCFRPFAACSTGSSGLTQASYSVPVHVKPCQKQPCD